MYGIGMVEGLLLAAMALFGVLLIVALVRNVARPEQADEWGRRHGVALTETTRPVVMAYLTRSRRFRLAGALIGLIVPFGTNTPGFEVMMGYLLGALVAELTQKRLPSDGGSSASLVPRSLGDYISRSVPLALRGVSALGAIYLALYAWGPQREAPSAGAWVGGAAAVALPLIVELLLRRMVARSQPAAAPELLAVDDAIRSSSVHAAAGAGLGASLLILGGMTWAVGFSSDVQLLRWIFPTLGLTFAVGALVVWVNLGPATPWKVQRTAHLPEGSA